MVTKKEKKEIINNAYRLAREGLLQPYMINLAKYAKYESVFTENQKKYLKQVSKINQITGLLKTLRFSCRHNISGAHLLGDAKHVLEKNFENTVPERVDTNYIRDEIEKILQDYYNFKIKELNFEKDIIKSSFDEIFNDALIKMKKTT